MYRHPLLCVISLFVGAVFCPIFLPLLVFLGYPALLISAAGLIVKSREGEIERPAQPACILAMLLGLVMILHGVAICYDTPLGGGSPNEQTKWLGNRLAYSGAAIALITACTAYAFERSHPKHIG